jgi:hypothetical protein
MLQRLFQFKKLILSGTLNPWNIDHMRLNLSQPHFGLSVRVKPTLPKVGTWSPPGLLKTQSSIWRAKTARFEGPKQLDLKGVLGVIGKVLKCRCLNWPRIGHLDIWSPSYGQKKGRESNWQFDSRPQKVGFRWWLPPSPGRGVSYESELACGLSQHQMHAKWLLTNSCWFWMQVRDRIAWSLPSLILELPTQPLYPF